MLTSLVVIYDCNMLLVQATGLISYSICVWQAFLAKFNESRAPLIDAKTRSITTLSILSLITTFSIDAIQENVYASCSFFCCYADCRCSERRIFELSVVMPSVTILNVIAPIRVLDGLPEPKHSSLLNQ